MSEKKIDQSFSIAPIWEKIRDVRKSIEQAMEEFSQDISQATAMTAAELIENAVKHSSADNTGINFKLQSVGNQVVVTVINIVRTAEDLQVFEETVEKIAKSDNLMELYLERLMELGDDPGESKTRLGLYRIAYEGEFSISYKLEKDTLTVIASRNFE